jgi:hypothetical protein
LKDYGDIIPGSLIFGLAVDDEGMLYVAAQLESGGIITKYDPFLEAIVKQIPAQTGYIPSDIMFKDPYIYVAGASEIEPSKIIRMTRDLTNSQELSGDPGSADSFSGPKRFIGKSNDSIYLIDGPVDMDNNPVNGLVSFDSFDGTEWTRFDPASIGKTQFAYLNPVFFTAIYFMSLE